MPCLGGSGHDHAVHLVTRPIWWSHMGMSPCCLYGHFAAKHAGQASAACCGLLLPIVCLYKSASLNTVQILQMLVYPPQNAEAADKLHRLMLATSDMLKELGPGQAPETFAAVVGRYMTACAAALPGLPSEATACAVWWVANHDGVYGSEDKHRHETNMPGLRALAGYSCEGAQRVQVL